MSIVLPSFLLIGITVIVPVAIQLEKNNHY